jgi:hypothetical protein
MNSKPSLDLADFIVHYPELDPDDPYDKFNQIMGAKREFRELIADPNSSFVDDDFFRNY